jgi:hypothetical protein
MVVTENSNPSQIEREKTITDTEKQKGIRTNGLQRGCAYHAAQFHDQTKISNRNRANASYGEFHDRQ